MHVLKIPLGQLAFIIEKAREFDEETEPANGDSGSNPTDDKGVAILEDSDANPTREELAGALDALDEDQRIELLALMWLGRGDFDRSEWRDALKQAREIHNAAETEYLIGTPLLADYLEEGTNILGYSLDDYEIGRL
jgi:Protein of unknown function (DUF3775)